MTGPEHFRQAAVWTETAAREFQNQSYEVAAVAARIAQGHATAALAAAVAARGVRGDVRRAWATAAAVRS